MSLAPLLLAVGASRHYLWAQFPSAMQGGVSKSLGAAATLVLLWGVYRSQPSRPLAWVVLWWAWEEAQTLLCGAAWAFSPWPVAPGQGICSGRIDFDLGAIGILIVAAIAMRLTPVNLDTPAIKG